MKVPLLSLAWLVAGFGFANAQDKSKEPSKPTLPWVAKADMGKLRGEWKVQPHSQAPRALSDDKAPSELVRALFAKDMTLRFAADNGFEFVGSKLQGQARNDGNKSEEVFKYGNYMNTTEPLLVITTKDGQSLTVSYIVYDHRLSVRYPAHSCSRSGAQFSFVRQADPAAKK